MPSINREFLVVSSFPGNLKKTFVSKDLGRLDKIGQVYYREVIPCPYGNFDAVVFKLMFRSDKDLRNQVNSSRKHRPRK